MKKGLQAYAAVLRLVRRLPAEARPYYAKYARENFVNYREVDAGDTEQLEELLRRAYNHSLWVLAKVRFSSAASLSPPPRRHRRSDPYGAICRSALLRAVLRGPIRRRRSEEGLWQVMPCSRICLRGAGQLCSSKSRSLRSDFQVWLGGSSCSSRLSTSALCSQSSTAMF